MMTERACYTHGKHGSASLHPPKGVPVMLVVTYRLLQSCNPFTSTLWKVTCVSGSLLHPMWEKKNKKNNNTSTKSKCVNHSTRCCSAGYPKSKLKKNPPDCTVCDVAIGTCITSNLSLSRWEGGRMWKAVKVSRRHDPGCCGWEQSAAEVVL